MNSTLFGQALRKRRRALGLTLAELANMTGVRQSSLDSLEKGKLRITTKTKNTITRALESREDDLCGPCPIPTPRSVQYLHRNVTTNSHIEFLELGIRAANVLEEHYVRTVAELITRSTEDILRMKNAGKKTLANIRGALARHGFALFGD